MRSLRLILGDADTGTPITQEDFARRSGVPLATLRAVETGRRPLFGVLSQIAVTVHAQWRAELNKWTLLNSDELYQKEFADPELFDPGDAYCDDMVLHRLLERTLDLFAAATKEQRLALSIHLNQYLRTVAVSFGIPRAALARTEPYWIQSTKPVVEGKRLPKTAVIWPVYRDGEVARTISPHDDAGCLFDFRSHRTFKADDYPAHSVEEHDQMLQMRTLDVETALVEERKTRAPKRDKAKKTPKEKVEHRLEIGS
ncbi:MAG TPA: helix-turn-helix transcriptional regulator [Chthoniobacterales bacterium]|nr:helix-turn-helix transcriptional regulator [Chthoniobacterales bacterium]